MTDILLFILKWWAYGMPVAFILRGVYVATDSFEYDGFFEIAVTAILWPIAIIYKIIEWWRYYR